MNKVYILIPYVFALAAFRIMKDGRLIAATWLACMTALAFHQHIPIHEMGPLVVIAILATLVHALLVKHKLLEGSTYAFPELAPGLPFWTPFAWMWVALTAYVACDFLSNR